MACGGFNDQNIQSGKKCGIVVYLSVKLVHLSRSHFSKQKHLSAPNMTTAAYLNMQKHSCVSLQIQATAILL